MGNTSIYIRNQPLVKRARKLAGDEGFSAFMEKALTDFVERKLAEERGFTDHSIFINSRTLIRFRGRRLAVWVYGRGEGIGEDPADAQAFQTTGGNLVVVLIDQVSGEGFGYKVYDTVEELAADRDHLSGIPDFEDFVEEIKQEMSENPTVWID